MLTALMLGNRRLQINREVRKRTDGWNIAALIELHIATKFGEIIEGR